MVNKSSETSRHICSIRSSRSDRTQLDAFVLQGIPLTLLDILWLAMAYGKLSKRAEAIESE